MNGSCTHRYEGQQYSGAHELYRGRESQLALYGSRQDGLGEAGKDMVALAAADYFFDNK